MKNISQEAENLKDSDSHSLTRILEQDLSVSSRTKKSQARNPSNLKSFHQLSFNKFEENPPNQNLSQTQGLQLQDGTSYSASQKQYVEKLLMKLNARNQLPKPKSKTTKGVKQVSEELVLLDDEEEVASPFQGGGGRSYLQMLVQRHQAHMEAGGQNSQERRAKPVLVPIDHETQKMKLNRILSTQEEKMLAEAKKLINQQPQLLKDRIASVQLPQKNSNLPEEKFQSGLLHQKFRAFQDQVNINQNCFLPQFQTNTTMINKATPDSKSQHDSSERRQLQENALSFNPQKLQFQLAKFNNRASHLPFEKMPMKAKPLDYTTGQGNRDLSERIGNEDATLIFKTKDSVKKKVEIPKYPRQYQMRHANSAHKTPMQERNYIETQESGLVQKINWTYQDNSFFNSQRRLKNNAYSSNQEIASQDRNEGSISMVNVSFQNFEEEVQQASHIKSSTQEGPRMNIKNHTEIKRKKKSAVAELIKRNATIQEEARGQEMVIQNNFEAQEADMTQISSILIGVENNQEFPNSFNNDASAQGIPSLKHSGRLQHNQTQFEPHFESQEDLSFPKRQVPLKHSHNQQRNGILRNSSFMPLEKETYDRHSDEELYHQAKEEFGRNVVVLDINSSVDSKSGSKSCEEFARDDNHSCDDNFENMKIVQEDDFKGQMLAECWEKFANEIASREQLFENLKTLRIVKFRRIRSASLIQHAFKKYSFEIKIQKQKQQACKEIFKHFVVADIMKNMIMEQQSRLFRIEKMQSLVRMFLQKRKYTNILKKVIKVQAHFKMYRQKHKIFPAKLQEYRLEQRRKILQQKKWQLEFQKKKKGAVLIIEREREKQLYRRELRKVRQFLRNYPYECRGIYFKLLDVKKNHYNLLSEVQTFVFSLNRTPSLGEASL